MGTTGCHQSKIKHDKPRTRSIFLGCSVCNGQTPNNYNHGGTQDGYTGTVITCLVRIIVFYCIEQLQETLNDMPSVVLLLACDGHKHTDDLFRTCPLMWTNVCLRIDLTHWCLVISSGIPDLRQEWLMSQYGVPIKRQSSSTWRKYRSRWRFSPYL